MQHISICIHSSQFIPIPLLEGYFLIMISHVSLFLEHKLLISRVQESGGWAPNNSSGGNVLFCHHSLNIYLQLSQNAHSYPYLYREKTPQKSHQIAPLFIEVLEIFQGPRQALDPGHFGGTLHQTRCAQTPNHIYLLTPLFFVICPLQYTHILHQNLTASFR